MNLYDEDPVTDAEMIAQQWADIYSYPPGGIDLAVEVLAKDMLDYTAATLIGDYSQATILANSLYRKLEHTNGRIKDEIIVCLLDREVRRQAQAMIAPGGEGPDRYTGRRRAREDGTADRGPDPWRWNDGGESRG